MVGIADLIHLRRQLGVCPLLRLGRHPGLSVNIRVQRFLQRLYQLQHPFLVLRREVLGYICLPHCFAEVIIGIDRTPAPARLDLLRSRQGAPEK